MRKFDLNVEKVLENWEIYHAMREIIANALDEQELTNSKEIQIYKDEAGLWHIKDYGRGLKYQHFTQNENKEKLDHEGLIGRFGVGLKDALATLYRRGVNVTILSANGKFNLSMETKENFPDITTLHVLVEDQQSAIMGTDFALNPITKADIDMAKSFFLKFSSEKLLEITEFGQVYSCEKGQAKIYVNGVKVAEEEKFLFSYNITSMTAAMKRALNRERTHVGRTAYADRVKSILLACSGEKVIRALVNDIELIEKGENSDETSWIDVAKHAIGHLNSMEKVIFVTPQQGIERGDIINNAQLDGYRVVFINEAIAQKIRGTIDPSGNQIRDLGQYVVEYNDSFQYKFVEPTELSSEESKVFEKMNEILELAGGLPANVKSIKISETMRLGNDVGITGVWETKQCMIVIKRPQLRNLSSFAGTLVHEVKHAESGFPDLCLGFELALTETLGSIIANSIKA